MRIESVTQYEAVKAKLEEIGFTNVPSSADLVISPASPVILNGSMQFKRQTVQDESIGLVPVN